MESTYAVILGDQGRLVIPEGLRARQRWEQGTPLVLVETDRGVVLASREQVKGLVRDQLTGSAMVAELLAGRRAAALLEEA